MEEENDVYIMLVVVALSLIALCFLLDQITSSTDGFHKQVQKRYKINVVLKDNHEICSIKKIK